MTIPHNDPLPKMPAVRDNFEPEAFVPFSPEECAKVVRDDSSAPALRRPGATVPKNADQKVSATFPDR